MILYDAHTLLTSNGQPVEMSVSTKSEPDTTWVLQVEPGDDVDMVLVTLNQMQGRPVIVVLPEKGSAFEQPDHFTKLRQMQDTTFSGQVIGFVIPKNRLGAVARHAHKQGFFFSSSLEKTLKSAQPKDHSAQSTEGFSTMEDLIQYTQAYRPETTEGEEVAIQNGHDQASRGAQPTYSQGPHTPLPETVLPLRPVPTRKRPRVSSVRMVIIAGLISVLVLVSATVLTVLFVGQPAAPAHIGQGASVAQVGTLAFSGSGQLDPTSSQGLNDQITLDLDHQTPPAHGNSYYAWLLPDQTNDEVKPLLLGTLNVQAGIAHLSYRSPEHSNLLSIFSRFRVTEQPSGTAPVTPSLDPRTWRSVGEIPNRPTPGDEKQYSLLSHLRHLLAKDPTLQSIGLNGGLDIWFYRNSGKLLEYATAARDDWPNKGATELMRRQIIRFLDYLNGSAYVARVVPLGTPFLIDPKAGRMGLLENSPTQNPPGYLAHVDIHLQGLANSPGHTDGQHRLALQLDQEITKITASMTTINADAAQLVRMNDSQLQQQHALDIIDDMVTNANAAYVGQPNPTTGENTGGVTFVHNRLQSLATMPITTPSTGDQ